jgi:hypothetical protein
LHKCLKIIFLTALIALFSGCASVAEMPFNQSVKAIDNSKGVLVGSITIQNKNKPEYQPMLWTVFVKKDGKEFAFIKPTFISGNSEGNKYLFSIAFEPGAAELYAFRFLGSGTFINGLAQLPFEQQITFEKNKIIYIGDITATIIPRENEEPRAGPVIPIIDQAVLGFSSGTFVVDIKDNYNTDIQFIKQKFPYLKDKMISKMILHPWEYPDE